MWQKARIIASTTHPELIGRELWVVAGAPVVKRTRDLEKNIALPEEPLFDCNILDQRKRPATVTPKGLELLPEFAEDVPRISWRKFLRGSL